MTILQFKRLGVVEEIVDCLRHDTDDVVEALVIGKRKSGARFSYMTYTDNIPELVGYLEALKTDLILEMIAQADRPDGED